MPVLGVGLWVAAPALADDGRGGPAARRSCERLALEVVTLERLPVQGVPRAGRQARRLLAATGRSDERREYTLGLARLLARLLPDDVERGQRSRRCRSAGARAGTTRAQDAALRALARRRRRARASSTRETGKRIRLALEPEPGCTVETIAQACDGARPGSRRSGSASAWTPAISRCSSRTPAEAVALLRGGGRPDRQDAGLVARCASTTRLRRRAASCWRASTSRGSCTRCASA